MKRKIEIIVLIIYTLINLKFLWPFISDPGLLIVLAIPGQQSTSTSYLSLFIGLFLNAALIFYWIKNRER